MRSITSALLALLILSGCATSYNSVSARGDASTLMIGSEQQVTGAVSRAIQDEFPAAAVQQYRQPEPTFTWWHQPLLDRTTFRLVIRQGEGLDAAGQPLQGYFYTVNTQGTQGLVRQRYLDPLQERVNERFTKVGGRLVSIANFQEITTERLATQPERVDSASSVASIALPPDGPLPSVQLTMPSHAKRTALVIGNSNYRGAVLKNPRSDALAIASRLTALGMEVELLLDADRKAMVTALSAFSKRSESSEVSLLYYAGHGVQVAGENFLLPTDIDMADTSSGSIALSGVSLNAVVGQYLTGRSRLVLLDACRNNPFILTGTRSISRGLAPISAASGTLIAYATKDGAVAADGDGKHSPFTEALLEHLGAPEDIALTLRRVRETVLKRTGGKQEPWEYGSLTGGALILSGRTPAKD